MYTGVCVNVWDICVCMHVGVYYTYACVLKCDHTPGGSVKAQGHSVPSSANSYSKDYDPEDWLQVDRATGWVQTQRVLSPASPFLKDGWYRAIILAFDDGEG